MALLEDTMTLSPQLIIGSLLTVALFILGHLGAAIWFASRVNTQMKSLAISLGALSLDMKQMASQDTRIAVLDQRVVNVETRMRETRDLVVEARGKLNG